jgi:hypothetical protein
MQSPEARTPDRQQRIAHSPKLLVATETHSHYDAFRTASLGRPQTPPATGAAPHQDQAAAPKKLNSPARERQARGNRHEPRANRRIVPRRRRGGPHVAKSTAAALPTSSLAGATRARYAAGALLGHFRGLARGAHRARRPALPTAANPQRRLDSDQVTPPHPSTHSASRLPLPQTDRRRPAMAPCIGKVLSP